jgi:hypothetical protein
MAEWGFADRRLVERSGGLGAPVSGDPDLAAIEVRAGTNTVRRRVGRLRA